MGAEAAFKGKVGVGATGIQGMGTWKISGMSTDMIEDTEFGDYYKTYITGQQDGGTVTFDGFYSASDLTGVMALKAAKDAGTDMSNIRCYINATSYFEPCHTAGYLEPANTTGNNTPVSGLYITDIEIGADKSGLITVSFSAKVSGLMVLN
jgi:hypothetical protein